jgi:glyoxylase-like metal-dependent hydrolase (beta-lactamase superfamily II)
VGIPEPRSLGHGFHAVSVPLPFRSPAWVNCYLIEGTELTLLDCGVDWREGLEALESGLRQVGFQPESIDRLIVTHLHPDHVGMAPRLSERWNCEIVMHERAVERIPRYNDTAAFAASIRGLARRHGVPDTMRPGFVDVATRAPFMPLMRNPDQIVADGDRIPLSDSRWLDVLHTPGHEASHICLRDSLTGILFSGDHVLPRITPVIMVDDEGTDVLGEYLASLQRLIELDVGLTYPAHGGVVEHGARRAEQISLHHDRRLSGMLDVVSLAPHTAWEVMLESYRPHLNSIEQRLALRETVSHLEHLRTRNQVTSFPEGELWFYRRSIP